MKGRRSFSIAEIERIETTIGQLPRVDANRRRRLLETLRRELRFYASDFARRGRRLTADEVERLIGQGVIRVHA
jgi:hypothetical protein